MARRRRSARRRTTRRTSFKRARRGRSSSSFNPIKEGSFAVGYGALRGYASGWVNKLSSFLPVQLSDEAMMTIVTGMVAKGKVPFLKGTTIKNIARAGFHIESARFGTGLVSGLMNNTKSVATTTTTTTNSFR